MLRNLINICNVLTISYNLQTVFMLSEKGRDLTQSYDKSPHTNINVKRAKRQHKHLHKKDRLHNGCGPT